MTKLDVPKPRFDPPAGRSVSRPLHTALVLQGGGALGSYQAGVYEAMARNGMAPDWLAGVSIGGINAALIAGNPPERRVERLREFWEQASSGFFVAPPGLTGASDFTRTVVSATNAWLVLTMGAPGFFLPRPFGPWLCPPGSPGALSVYDTTPLRETLLRLIDFDRLNDPATRLMLGAVNVGSGNSVVFDSAAIRIRPEHIMASAALPPGLPPVEIDGEFYWDGGLVTNTPLQFVLDEARNTDLVIMQVDLFPARGPLPRTLSEAEERQKDIRYSSRTRFNTQSSLRGQRSQAALRRLLDALPPDLADSEDAHLARDVLWNHAITLVQLIYRKQPYEGGAKDYEFSRQTMLEHWASGVADVEHFSACHPGGPPLPSEDGVLVIDPGLQTTAHDPAAAPPTRGPEILPPTLRTVPARTQGA